MSENITATPWEYDGTEWYPVIILIGIALGVGLIVCFICLCRSCCTCGYISSSSCSTGSFCRKSTTETPTIEDNSEDTSYSLTTDSY